jgi:dethiobiotin synthetase
LTKGCFITATDTNAGKTWIALGLMSALQRRGLRVAGMKPVASGCVRTDQGRRNADALMLMRQSDLPLAYEDVNPYAFEPAIAPHIAAEESRTGIDLHRIVTAYERLGRMADFTVVEGVGGWRVPLTETLGIRDLAAALGLPVILVAGLRLGGINHALLTAEAIVRDRIPFAGWIANRVDPDYGRLPQTIATLKAGIKAPCLAAVPWLPTLSADSLGAHLSCAAAFFGQGLAS